MAFITPVAEHWLEQKPAQWDHIMRDRGNDPLHHILRVGIYKSWHPRLKQ